MDILSFVASSLAFGFVIIAVFMAQQTRFKVLVNTVFWFSIACLVGARFYIEADVASPVGLVSRSVSMWEVTKQFVAGTPLTYIRKSYGEQAATLAAYQALTKEPVELQAVTDEIVKRFAKQVNDEKEFAKGCASNAAQGC